MASALFPSRSSKILVSWSWVQSVSLGFPAVIVRISLRLGSKHLVLQRLVYKVMLTSSRLGLPFLCECACSGSWFASFLCCSEGWPPWQLHLCMEESTSQTEMCRGEQRLFCASGPSKRLPIASVGRRLICNAEHAVTGTEHGSLGRLDLNPARTFGQRLSVFQAVGSCSLNALLEGTYSLERVNSTIIKPGRRTFVLHAGIILNTPCISAR